MDQGETLVEDNKRYKSKILELKAQVKKLEVSEKKLKELVSTDLSSKIQKASVKIDLEDKPETLKS